MGTKNLSNLIAIYGARHIKVSYHHALVFINTCTKSLAYAAHIRTKLIHACQL